MFIITYKATDNFRKVNLKVIIFTYKVTGNFRLVNLKFIIITYKVIVNITSMDKNSFIKFIILKYEID